MSYILETNKLTKKYGKKNALINATIHVEQGDIYGLVGRNGAGKTTLMKIVGGLLRANSGDYSFFGKKSSEIGMLASRRGMLIEDPGFYGEYDGETNLWIKCLALGVKDKTEPKRMLEAVGLGEVGRKKVKKYSFGMKQRLGIAMAMLGNPDLVILDEPINGLDPQGISDVRDIIQKKSTEEGTTFLISSHILDELSKIATNYSFINKGEVIQEISTQELLDKCESKIQLITNNTRQATTILEKIGISNYKVLNDDVIHIYERLDRTGDITLALSAENVATLEIVRQHESLENYYINLVGKDGE